MSSREQNPTPEFFVGQKGEFLLLDSYARPIETVRGEVVRIMPSENSNSVYALIATDRGIRPGRLS